MDTCLIQLMQMKGFGGKFLQIKDGQKVIWTNKFMIIEKNESMCMFGL